MENEDVHVSSLDKTKPTVLLVEDSYHNRNIIGHVLEQLKFQVVSCENGEKAVQALDDLDGANLKLVFCDIMMPGINGIVVCKKVLSIEQFKDVPIIIVTASNEKSYLVEAKELGVRSYLLKPLSAKKIIASIQKIYPDTGCDFDL